MTAKTEMRILNLYKGKPLKQAVRALEIMKLYTAQKQLELRLKLQGLSYGTD